MKDPDLVYRLVMEGRGNVEISEMVRTVRPSDVAEVRAELIGSGVPLKSPYGLVQERVEKDPLHRWRVAVVCCLLNKTHARQVRPMYKELFARYPSPEDLSKANQLDLEGLLKPLGLYKGRARSLIAMSKDVSNGVPIEQCHGVGEYSRQSMRIFVDGDTSFDPTDRFLVRYVEWVRGGRKE